MNKPQPISLKIKFICILQFVTRKNIKETGTIGLRKNFSISLFYTVFCYNADIWLCFRLQSTAKRTACWLIYIDVYENSPVDKRVIVQNVKMDWTQMKISTPVCRIALTGSLKWKQNNIPKISITLQIFPERELE